MEADRERGAAVQVDGLLVVLSASEKDFDFGCTGGVVADEKIRGEVGRQVGVPASETGKRIADREAIEAYVAAGT